jgi:hypothetical protein
MAIVDYACEQATMTTTSEPGFSGPDLPRYPSARTNTEPFLKVGIGMQSKSGSISMRMASYS